MATKWCYTETFTAIIKQANKVKTIFKLCIEKIKGKTLFAGFHKL